MEPDVLVSRLDEALPGFASHFEGWVYLFARRPAPSVFAACADFIQQRPVPTGAWPRLAKVVSEVVDGDDSALSEAACTTFLARVTPPGHPIGRHLTGKARRFWLDRRAQT